MARRARTRTTSTSTPRDCGRRRRLLDLVIEEGWDYGYVEALVDGEWVTVPLYDDSGTEVTTDADPHDNNDGNGSRDLRRRLLRRRPGVRPPADRSAPGGHDGRAVPLLDRRGVPRHRVLRRRRAVDGARRPCRRRGHWILTEGLQTNNWVVQILSPCDLTPTSSENEIVDDAGNYVYRLEGNERP